MTETPTTPPCAHTTAHGLPPRHTARKVPPRTWREEYEAAEALGQLELPIARDDVGGGDRDEARA